MKNPVKFYTLLLIMFVFASCAPRVVLKTPDTAASVRAIHVSEEEFGYFSGLAKNGKTSEERAKGAFWSGQYYYNKKDYESALKYFSHNQRYYADMSWGVLSALRAADIALEQKDYEAAAPLVKFLLEKRHQFPDTAKPAEDRMKRFIALIPPGELTAFYEKKLHPVIDENILYTRCTRLYAENNFTDFLILAQSFLIQYRDSPYYEEISAKFKSASKYKPVDNRMIGVILPLTGPSMEIGTSIKNGIELALSEYNAEASESERITLAYIDEALEDKLEHLVIQAIEERNVIAFLGPVFSKTVRVVLPVMERYNTALFSPTAAQPELAGISPYFFRNCGTAKGQAYALARYIIKETGYRRLGAIYPQNTFGDTLTGFFTSKFTSLGGTIVKQASFNPAKTDFREEIVSLGGIDTMLVKDKRSSEALELNAKMEDAGKSIIDSVYTYLNLPPDSPTPVPASERLPRTNLAILRLSAFGENIKKYDIDNEMTRRLSFRLARANMLNVQRQAVSDKQMADVGIEPEDLDRDLALHIARRMDCGILVYGGIIESKSDTIYANFMPEEHVDSSGVTKVSYGFTDEDYFDYTIRLFVMSVADENVIGELTIPYRKVKEPAMNPLDIEALYIPAPDNKIILIKDQLKFYDFDLPVFGSSALSSGYILSFLENVEGIVYPADFFPGSDNEATVSFISAFRDKYARAPDMLSANSYDAMSLVTRIIRTGVDSRENFKNLLKGSRNYSGASGMFSFDADGDSIRDYYIMRIERPGPKLLKEVREN
ncbi:MAG TPA: hypothetical protein ENN43_02380 [bacterium]|nr:hypothetical protein [bacterium]